MNAFPSTSLSDNQKSKIQNRKWAGLVAIVALMVCGAVAQAQPPAKVARVGFLDSSTAPGTELKGIEVSPEPSG